jgi:hypothetical protein
MATFLPGLEPRDPQATWWLRQVTLRLRREVCWLWHERSGRAPDPDRLPPFSDRLAAVLDFRRYRDLKQDFYRTDVTASYLTDKLHEASPDECQPARGSFGWAVEELGLNDAARFTLALALAAAFDSSMGTVIGSCLNDAARTHPTLALAQRLWDRPEEILEIADPAHALYRAGLLHRASTDSPWDDPVSVPPVVARQILFPDSGLPSGLEPLREGDDEALSEGNRPVLARLRAEPLPRTQIVPVLGPRGSDRAGIAAAVGFRLGAPAVRLDTPAAQADRPHARSLATVCWLRGESLFLDEEGETDRSVALSELLAPPSIPIRIYVAAEHMVAASVPPDSLLPALRVGRLAYDERARLWKHCLGPAASGLESEIAECARRFRYERATIRRIAHGVLAAREAQHPNTQHPTPNTQRPLSSSDLFAACRAELSQDMGELAQRVTPRFGVDELVLPPKQARQFDEICRAMASLTEVHYRWGTARVWNESGIAALFAGPPGTGKTMAAEVLAARLDLPMYRIDLSQVVNKYVGETEKNLKRVFDAADRSDTLLFFDEADALFGRRTEVKDAHDRYANLEISYLLERMERFTGLAILATNRKKDLDEAFLRRLRFVLDFPLPETAQRKVIWRQVIPECVDVSELDFDFLAKQFPLAGAHIRSIVFNACLQSAGEPRGPEGPRLTMEQVLICVRRELEKLNRPASLDQFGPYARAVDV